MTNKNISCLKAINMMTVSLICDDPLILQRSKSDYTFSLFYSCSHRKKAIHALKYDVLICPYNGSNYQNEERDPNLNFDV